MPNGRILLFGATGYVGGSVLASVVSSSHATLKSNPITVAVRGESNRRTLQDRYESRIHAILFEGLTDSSAVEDLASRHDFVINAATGFHAGGAASIVRGLGKRTAATGRETWMIQTSGTSNLSDRPITGEAHPDRTWDDRDSEAIYEFEKAEEAVAAYPQRTAELAVVDAGIEFGVKTIVVQLPLLWGFGEGLFRKNGTLVALMTHYVLQHGYGMVLGARPGAVMGSVHVMDAAELYVLLLIRILEGQGENIPTGKAGIIIPTGGVVTCQDLAEGAVAAAHTAGKILHKQIKEVSIAEAASMLGGQQELAEVAFAGHVKVTGSTASRLGWTPVRGEEDWAATFGEQLQAAPGGQRLSGVDW